MECAWIDETRFVARGCELGLYRVAPLKSLEGLEGYEGASALSETTGARLVATVSGGVVAESRCMDARREEEAAIVALGLPDGRVALADFGRDRKQCEFAPRFARPCNAVSWNPKERRLVACALDKHRNDHCVLLWDTGSRSTKPSVEMGLSEHAHSLAWSHFCTRTLVVGMNQKQIKVFDLREVTSKSVQMVATRSVYGICVDLHRDYEMASRVDNVVTIWDRRYFEKPLFELTQNKIVTKVSWCPTRSNALGYLQRDSPWFHIIDLHGLGIEDDTYGYGISDLPLPSERSVVTGSNSPLVNFSWHPTDYHRVLIIGSQGLRSMNDFTVSERITVNFNSGPVVYSHSNNTLRIVDEDISEMADDISIKMKVRLANEYGFKNELWLNGDVADGDKQVKKLWYWLNLSKSLIDEGCIRGINSKHPGVKHVLKYDSAVNTSGSSFNSFMNTTKSDFLNLNIHNNTYRSEDRDRAIQLCCWNFDKDTSSITPYLEKLEGENEITRAAAIAVFNMKLRLAIDILNRSAEKHPENTNLALIAMALAGYSESPGSAWRQLCSSLHHIADPYVRGIFAFLTSENSNYDAVLNENGMLIEDRIAFACMFLPDAQLSDYINQLVIKLTEEGNLTGIILTGVSIECISLLQQYLDNTGDIQTVCLIVARAFPSELLKESQVEEWIKSYRNLLDSWHLWAQRALFDIALNTCHPSNKPIPQVYVTCNFCGKNVSAFLQGVIRNHSTFARIGANSSKFKISACPHCRKPLPRCAICLLHMGAHGALGVSNNNNAILTKEANKTTDFSSWFTFCQTCRHGGHSGHLTQWFRSHVECPVTSCTCKCSSIDALSSNPFINTTS